MSMFAKDRLMARDGYLTDFAPAPKLEEGQELSTGTEFILHGCVKVADDWKTELGTTPLWHLTVSKVDSPEEYKVVSALGAVMDSKLSEKEDGDLPAIVVSQIAKSKIKGNNDAYVITFVDEYTPAKGKRQEILMDKPA